MRLNGVGQLHYSRVMAVGWERRWRFRTQGCDYRKMPAASKRRVLIVDDDKRLADTLALILDQHGFTTSVAYSGANAIRSALKTRPDCVLMDVFMDGVDGVDGVETAIAIRQAIPGCRVLLMSGAADDIDMLDKASRRGDTFEVLMKPVLITSLLETLRTESGSTPGKL